MAGLPSQRYLRRAIRLMLFTLVLYGLACLALSLGQRSLMYFPYDGPTDPVKAGLPAYQHATFDAADGAPIPYWLHAGEATQPLILYLHGNGGGLHAFTPALDWLDGRGLGVAAMEYRGFGDAPGKPSERVLVADALAFYDHLAQQFPGRPIVVWGYSLGSGVATQLAAQRPATALVLEAPFSAALDLAREFYPVFPVGKLMHDQYLSREFISDVRAPILILHGTDDRIVPIHSGRRLYKAAPEPKHFNHYVGAGHLDLIDTPAYDDALAFIKRYAVRAEAVK